MNSQLIRSALSDAIKSFKYLGLGQGIASRRGAPTRPLQILRYAVRSCSPPLAAQTKASQNAPRPSVGAELSRSALPACYNCQRSNPAHAPVHCTVRSDRSSGPAPVARAFQPLKICSNSSFGLLSIPSLCLFSRMLRTASDWCSRAVHGGCCRTRQSQ